MTKPRKATEGGGTHFSGNIHRETAFCSFLCRKSCILTFSSELTGHTLPGTQTPAEAVKTFV